jgi:hypothetical protein
MGYHRGRPKLHLHLVAGGILILACGVAAYWFTSRENDVWAAAKAEAAARVGGHPVFPLRGEINEHPSQPGQRAFTVESYADIDGEHVEWEALVVKTGGQCRVVECIIDPDSWTQRAREQVATGLTGH